MKIRRKLLFSFIAISAMLLSCKSDFEEIFDTPASVRIQNYMDSCTEILQRADNGWEMLYYVNGESKGYNLLFSFTDEKNVLIAGNHELIGSSYKQSVSTYETNNSNGPILAFDLYNEVLHPFADPDGASLAGDYEFVIMDYTNDKVTLKGKMNASNIIMNALPADLSFSDYFTKIEVVKEKYFSADAPTLTLNVHGDSLCALSNADAFIFETTIETASYSLPFAAMLKGFSFYEAEELTGFEAQNFELASDKNALVSTEAAEVTITGPSAITSYMLGTTANWDLQASDLSSNIMSLYNRILASVSSKYSGASGIYIALVGEEKAALALRLGFNYAGNKIEGDLYFTKTINGDTQCTLSYSNTGNSAGNSFKSSIDGYTELAQLLSGTYHLSTTYPVSVHEITFTNNNNSDTWLKVARIN